MLCRTSILFAILLTVLLVSCRGKQASPPLIHVGNREITLEQFDKEFRASLPTGQNPDVDVVNELKRSFLVQIIDRELVLAEADRLDISIAPSEVEAALLEYRKDYPEGSFQEILRERGITIEALKTELKGGLLMEKVVRQAVYSGIQVSDEEVLKYYRENRKDFDRPEQVRARQIVVATQEEGQELLGLLRQGRDFSEIARERSLSPDGEQGGDLGFFARGEMPTEFEDVTFSLPVGRLSDLVKSEYGYHIFLVDEKRRAARTSLDEAREEILRALRAQKEEAAYHAWLQKLRSEASIEIDWSLL